MSRLWRNLRRVNRHRQYCSALAAVFYENPDFAGYPTRHSFATNRVFTVSDSIENRGMIPTRLHIVQMAVLLGFRTSRALGDGWCEVKRCVIVSQSQKIKLTFHIRRPECIGTLCRYHNTAGIRRGHCSLHGRWTAFIHPAACRHSIGTGISQIWPLLLKRRPGMWEMLSWFYMGEKMSPDETLA